MRPLLRAYYDVIKPERTYANVMTAAAGFLFAAQRHIGWGLFAATLLGTTLVVMSACALNNATDRGIDTEMPRTQRRPVVTGLLPVRNVVLLSVVLGLVGFAVLAAYTNWLTVLIGVVAYVDYTVLYGWSKRTTPHSTLIGTISGAAPLVAGYTAVTGRFDLTALLLMLIMVFWQMPHFYAIGIYRRDDYRAARLPVWPVAKGVRSTQRWILVYTVLYVLAGIGLAIWGTGGMVFGLVMGAMGVYWLVRLSRGFGAADVAGWARRMFGFSLLSLTVLSVVLAGSPWLP